MIGRISCRVLWSLIALWVCSLGLAQSPKRVVINEFMASNGHTLADAGQYEDWIELYNPSGQPVDVGGMYLTDDLADPTKWQFPQGTTLGANGFLWVWADGDTQAQGLHAGFNLASEGEELGLSDPNGTLIDSIVFEGQLADVSFGRWPDGNNSWQYMATPTPGKANVQGSLGVVADVEFSPVRGFYDTPIDVTLSTDTEGAEIWYTLDAKVPHTSYIDGRGLTHWIGQSYTGPIRVERTTCIWAVAFKAGWRDSGVMSHTYLFLDDVIRQSMNGEPPGSDWPKGTINGQMIEYGMDPAITRNATWGPQMEQALVSIPTLSIVTDLANLFDPKKGIYVNASGHGEAWECPISLELIYPTNPQGPGFPDLIESPDGQGGTVWMLPQDMAAGLQINAGLRIRGGYSRSGDNPKHAFRVFFRSEYGDGELQYRLFGDEGQDHFDCVDIRTSQNYSWSYAHDPANTLCREVWARDSQGQMGQPYTHSRYYHLYINGQYWGIYMTQERPEASYGATYLGGTKGDYDAVKATGPNAGYTIEATDGTMDNWRTLWELSILGFNNSANYYRALGLNPDGTRNPQYPVLLDADNLIDYMLMVLYDGDRDAPISNFLSNTRPNNWFSLYNRADDQGFVYFIHDAEHILSRGMTDRTGPYLCGDQLQYSNPQWIHQELMAHPDYRIRFADRAYKHLFNDGPLTPDRAIARFKARAAQIDMAIIAESARWGSASLNKTTWQAAINNEVQGFFPSRTQTLIGQLKQTRLRNGTLAPLYPSIDPPKLSLPGGAVAKGQTVSMTAATGSIYYTLDGSDPRLSQSNQGTVYSVMLLTEDVPKKVWVPTMDIGEIWRGGNEPFDDSTWTQGMPTSQGKTGAVGYEAQSGYEAFITYDVRSVMYGKNASCYIRIPFAVEPQDLEVLRSMTLRVRCDDGFVAFLNGVEVAAVNRPATLAWNSRCATRPESSDFVDMDISSYVSALRSGNNVLAVHGLNRGAGDSDFLFSAELIASEAGTTDSRVSFSAIRYTEPLTLKASVQVKARVLTTEWSALNEAVYAVGPVVDNLRISEIMYHPKDPNAEFIELTNIDTETINLALVRFTQGIDFTFPAMDLAPGQYVLVVSDINAFESVYGKGLSVAGQYSGGLSNGGERIQLCDALGQIIVDFTYADDWYAITDGQGYSLTVMDVKTDPNDLSSAGRWRPSAHLRGSPGRAGF